MKGEIDSDILITSDVHNDICLLTENEIIWSESLSFDYSQITIFCGESPLRHSSVGRVEMPNPTGVKESWEYQRRAQND